MIKTTLKNFFKNIVYVFIPMGIIYLFLLISIFLFCTNFVQNLSSTITSLGGLLESTIVQSESSLADFFSYAIGRVDWHGDFLETLNTIFESNWINETIQGFIETIATSTEGMEEELNEIIAIFTGNIIISLFLVFILFILSIFIANFVTRFFIRKHLAQRTIKNTILAYTLIPILQVTAIVLFLILYVKVQYCSWLILILFLLLNNALSLISSWIVYRKKDLKLSSILNFKNFFSSILCTIMITLFDVIIFLLLLWMNAVIAFLLMIPIVIYSYGICDLQVDAYVYSLVSKNNTICE